MTGTIFVCFGTRTRRPSKGRQLVAAAAGQVARWARRCCFSLPRRQRAPASPVTEQLDAHGDNDDDKGRDCWSGLPEDLLLDAMALMEVTDVVRAGAVCSSWRSAYAEFRRLRLPAKPNPPPCLMHANADGAAAIYSPSTGATFPCGGGGNGFITGGSAHGWVFAADAATANPCLLNPLTGERAALPAVATLARVKGTFFDDDGTAVYDVDHAFGGGAPDMQLVTARTVRNWMFRHVAISAAGVVLLVHMPHGEASCARPGDERWTSLSSQLEHDAISVVHNDDDGLFYVLCRGNGSIIFAVVVDGPGSPTAWPMSYLCRFFDRRHTHYLVFRDGELLVLTRHLVLTRPREGEKDISTIGISIEKVGLGRSRLVSMAGIGEDYALFLGYGSPICLPVKEYPMLRPNCAYLADDSEQHFPPITRRDVGIWDFKSRSMSKFKDLRPWLDNQPPIWIIPSLY
uniref:DUF295 domain-containing protein n=1 Tax=Hordeum vulgare subsp. vulgare TaxID=112509 RepID=A0A8I6Z9G8_HORVV